MKRLLVILLFPIISCGVEQKRIITNSSSGETKEEVISSYFKELEATLLKDNGEFWGVNLYGPLLIVDPHSKRFYSNVNTAKKEFKKIEKIYTDTLPENINIANTTIYWKNKKWAMVMTPLPKDSFIRNKLFIHELFHRVQETLDFNELKEVPNEHLDTREGRILLKLELEALKKALESVESRAQIEHIANALKFRSSRYENPSIKQNENVVELKEGLAEYTGLMLSQTPEKAKINYLIQSIHKFYDNPSYVRSFAYETVPAYGYLLYQKEKNWHLKISKESNLTAYFLKAFGVTQPTLEEENIEKIGEIYNYDRIIEFENKREEERLTRISVFKEKFFQSPHFKIHFKNMNISFNPSNLVPLENLGTVYSAIRISDIWGVLEVEGSALISQNWDYTILSPPVEIYEHLILGQDWKLTLGEGWKIKKEKGNYKLVEE